jgi:hypothetical protein
MNLVDVVRLVAAVSTLLAFGHGLATLLAHETAFTWSERTGIAFLLGTGAASMLWTILMPLYAIVSPVVALSMIAWTVAGISLIRDRVHAKPDAIEPRRRSKGSDIEAAEVPGLTGTHRVTTIALTIVLIVELIVLSAASFRSGLGFDGVFNFEMRAHIAFENSPRGQIPLALFRDESLTWSHLRYPLLVPFAEYWIYAWLGRADQVVVKILFPMFYLALVGAATGAVRRAAGKQASLAAATAMGTLPAMMVIPGAISGYAEVPLAAVFTAAIGCALVAVRTGRPHAFRVCGALLAIAAWTKTEGAILAIGLAVPAAVIAGRKAIPLFALPGVVIASWGVFQHVYGVPDPDFPSFSPSVALANFDRIPTIARIVVREFATPGHWGLVWPAFAVMCATAIRRGNWRDTDAIAAAVVCIPLCIYPAAYLFSSWREVDAHLRTSFTRLLVPLAPAAIVFTFVQLWRPPAAVRS